MSSYEGDQLILVASTTPALLEEKGAGDCGMQPRNQSWKEVTDGHHALPGTWPWLISIQIFTPKGPRHSCDGAVVDVRWILAAAHCFSTKENSLKVWNIVLGATDLSRLPDIAQFRSIKRIIFHQDYNPSAKINDVALIELDSPVTFNAYVQPICLPPVSLDSEAFSICYVSGWNSSGISAVVYEVKADILETTTCNSSEWYQGRMNPHTLCAGLQERDSDSCQGHSGGLLMCKTLPKSPYYIVGISNSEKDCARIEYPRIYTSVQQFLEWISRKMGSQEIRKEKVDRKIEESSSVSITDVPKETVVIQPPFIPQETVPTLLDPPYVPEETTPSPPVSPFIPTETKFILELPPVDEPFHMGHKAVDSSVQYRLPNTTALPPEYVPPEAEVTLEPPYIPLENPDHLEPPFIPPEASILVEPPYTLQETTASLEPPYTPQEITTPLEPPYTPTETSVPLENPYLPLETSVIIKAPIYY
ncbi:acrosin-like [Protobothrops mucrosquamatus]|uniref:acrosin-like n=1 Tax=Protobothrops mucrosquamatus TaxID=103944 RepID=UPI0010FB2E73|nr:acrosin-like [Protobothrops mucrosquamatus]